MYHKCAGNVTFPWYAVLSNNKEGENHMNPMLKLLTRRSFAASRTRNLMAVLAIALTALLFTSVATIALGAMESMTLTMQVQKGSKSDGDFRNMTAQQYEALGQADFVAEYGLRMPVGFLENTTRHNVELDVMDETEAELLFCNPSHGSMPQAANEVVASDAALEDLGSQAEVGAPVTIQFTARGQTYTLDMVVSGWYEATNDQVSTMVVGTAFRDAYPDLFQNTFATDREMVGTYWSDIVATSTVGLQDAMDDWARSVGGDPEDASAANSLPAVVNTVTNPTPSLPVLAMGAALVVLFIFCGYLLIYNVFDIAVMQDIRRYGLYRTIGMSRKQVRRLINRQALWLACIGILLGLLLGFFVGRAALPQVMGVLAVSYQNIAVNVTPHPLIFVAAAVLAALTVFLSTRKPARVAANIPPIEAFRFVEGEAGKRKTRKSAESASLSRLAWSNLGRNKRRTAFIMVSMMLCVVLLNSAGVAAGSVDVEKQVSYSIRTDFAVVNAASVNGQEGFTRRDQGLSQDLMAAIDAQPGVEDASAVYKNTQEDSNVTYDIPVALEKADVDANGDPIVYTAKDGFILKTGDDGRPMCNVYGLEESALARMNLQEGETDAHALYQKMEQGEGVVVGTLADFGTAEIDERLDMAEVGDTITVYKNGEPILDLPILAKAAINGDDQEIGFTSNGPVEVGGDGLYLYLPTSVYTQIYDEPTVYKYSFNVAEDQQEAMTDFLENYVNNVDPSVAYASAQSAREAAQGTQTTIRLVGNLLGIIFGVAGVLNLINTLVTTILIRRHEFATMQSIGMTRRQLRSMLVHEGLFYALGGCLLGLVFSVVLAFTLVQGLTSAIWYFTFHFTLLPALVACVVLLVVAALVPVWALRQFHRGSIVEQLRIAE